MMVFAWFCEDDLVPEGLSVEPALFDVYSTPLKAIEAIEQQVRDVLEYNREYDLATRRQVVEKSFAQYSIKPLIVDRSEGRHPEWHGALAFCEGLMEGTKSRLLSELQ